MMIMTSYYRIRDDAIKFFANFIRILQIVYSYQVLASSNLNKKNTEQICVSGILEELNPVSPRGFIIMQLSQ